MRNPRVEFRLTMPGVASWNGRWSGEGRNYVIVRTLSAADVERLAIPTSWYHHWDDGWGAEVHARVMEKGERGKKSDGFHGYDWMVDRIVRWGDTRCRCEWRPDPNSGQPGWEGEWERCCLCGTSRKIKTAEVADA